MARSTKESFAEADDIELNAKLQEAFDKIDLDKNGEINGVELKMVFQTAGYTVTEKAIQVSLWSFVSYFHGFV